MKMSFILVLVCGAWVWPALPPLIPHEWGRSACNVRNVGVENMNKDSITKEIKNDIDTFPLCYSALHHNNQLLRSLNYSRQNQKAEQQYRTHFLHNSSHVHSLDPHSGRTSPNSPLGEMSAGQRGGGSEGAAPATVHTIPVVIHVINPPGQSLLTDTEIQSGLSFLNGVLAGTQSCFGDPLSTPTGIQLCLAQQDIFGNATIGIRRYTHSMSDLDMCTQDKALKELPRQVADSFPTTDYMNIYIVREVCASCQPWNCAVSAFASLPAAHGTVLDGLVCQAPDWNAANCDDRKTIIHELGHYFNLLHTFEGGCKNDNCLEDGDRVCDTPPDKDYNYYLSNPCTQGGSTNSCNTDVNAIDPNNPFTIDQNDLTNNFMDYAPAQCSHTFTPGQVLRMEAAILGPRASLLQSKGCENTVYGY